MTGTILFGVLTAIALTLTIHSATPAAPQFWPEMTCHHLYDHSKQKSFSIANLACVDGTQTRSILEGYYGINDKHGCILWRLQGIIVGDENNTRTFEYVENKGLRKSLLTIFSGLFARNLNRTENQKRRAFVNSLLEKSADCKPLLNELANVKKRPSKDWTEFYECINYAWKCSDSKATNEHTPKSTVVSSESTTLSSNSTASSPESTTLIPLVLQ